MQLGTQLLFVEYILSKKTSMSCIFPVLSYTFTLHIAILNERKTWLFL